MHCCVQSCTAFGDSRTAAAVNDLKLKILNFLDSGEMPSKVVVKIALGLEVKVQRKLAKPLTVIEPVKE